MKKFDKSEAEWRQLLTAEEFRITRQKETELPFTGKYYDFKRQGIYHCVCCNSPLFSSGVKYDSGSGWPSFWEPLSAEDLGYSSDSSLGMVRTEITCGACGAHLGHVFSDGPQPTGQRYCVNSVALQFRESLK